ncbi:MAG: DUF6797 domain-containing protein, partial [Verrucomicrobiota bacterium]
MMNVRGWVRFWVILFGLGTCLTGSAQEKRRLIEVGTLPGKMRFAPEWLLVQPGEALTIQLNNTCHMQHNFVLCQPGEDTAMKVARAAWALGASAVEKAWVPETPLVLAASPLVNPGESRSFEIAAPTMKGDYPYVCTLPGHAIVMRGILRVGDPGDQPPEAGGSTEAIPESAVERAAQKMKRYRRFMDGGPTVSGVIMPGQAVHPETGRGLPATVNKGVVVKVGANGEGAVLFDTELMNYAAGWTGGFVDFMKGREDERSEYRYEVGGDLHFSRVLEVDWADRTGSYDDPRERRLGPLHADWLEYGGLYHHGERIVFRYRVHGREVLDSPSIESGNRFVRTLKVGPGTVLLRLRAFGGEEVRIPGREDAVALQVVFEDGEATARRSGAFPDLPISAVLPSSTWQ